MADNVAITAGAGVSIAADDVSSVFFQKVKLDFGTDGASAPALAGAGAVATGVQRVTLASDDPAVVDLAAIEALLITIDADTSNITACNTGAVVLATGSAAIGKLAANSGIDIGDVDVTSIIAGVGATNLGKARDSALGATDTGVMALAVRDDTLTTLTPVDGDYVPLRVSSTGQLHVTGGGGGTEYTEDVATANPIVGGAVMMERDDALGGLTPIEGDWAALRCDANGALWVHDNVVNTLLGTIDADTGAIKLAVEIMDDWDATHASAASADGPQVMGAGYSAGLPTDVGADGDAARICTDRFGRILRGIMPQRFTAIFDSADASAEANVVKAKTASRKIYILSITISVDAEMWVKLQDEDSNALTCKHWFKAGGGKTITYPPEAPLVLDVVNKDLEVITEGAGNIGVEVTGYLAV